MNYLMKFAWNLKAMTWNFFMLFIYGVIFFQFAQLPLGILFRFYAIFNHSNSHDFFTACVKWKLFDFALDCRFLNTPKKYFLYLLFSEAFVLGVLSFYTRSHSLLFLGFVQVIVNAALVGRFWVIWMSRVGLSLRESFDALLWVLCLMIFYNV